ncbi:hypothetical protein ACQE98_09595 [Ornithinimicrobium sp. W1679]|uniref:hypothetical protein n=1 Tax=Ornithinimicrobium sp. W1679 TaxID=3418770 RepID=UPI003CED2AFC
MNRSTDRSQDPSPFAWIFGGALAMVAAMSIVRAVTGRGRAARSSPVASVVPSSGSTADDELAGHPS